MSFCFFVAQSDRAHISPYFSFLSRSILCCHFKVGYELANFTCDRSVPQQSVLVGLPWMANCSHRSWQGCSSCPQQSKLRLGNKQRVSGKKRHWDARVTQGTHSCDSAMSVSNFTLSVTDSRIAFAICIEICPLGLLCFSELSQMM